MKKIFLLCVLISFCKVKLNAQCTAVFAASADTVFSGQNVIFTAAVGLNCAFYWKINNAPYTLQLPIHSETFYTNGVQNICLAILDTISFCTDTFCSTVFNINCGASFLIYPDTTGPPHTYVGVNQCFGNNLSYLWTWGDGNTSTGPAPSHTYAAAGNYNICVQINDGAGCLDTFCNAETINKNTAMYTVNFGNIPSEVKEMRKDFFYFYPNPVKDLLFVKHNNMQSLEIRISNLVGIGLFSKSIKKDEAIDFSTYPTGLYGVQVFEKNNCLYQSLIEKIK